MIITNNINVKVGASINSGLLDPFLERINKNLPTPKTSLTGIHEQESNSYYSIHYKEDMYSHASEKLCI